MTDGSDIPLWDPANPERPAFPGAQHDASSWDEERGYGIPDPNPYGAGAGPPGARRAPGPPGRGDGPPGRRGPPGGRYRGPGDTVPGRGAQRIGRDARGNICCPPFWNVCVLPECRHEFLRELELMLITSRGPTFRGPPHCVQPANGRDADAFQVQVPIDSATGSFTEVVRVSARGNETAVVKGIAWIAALTSSSAKLDPYTQVRLSLQRGPTGFTPGAGKTWIEPYVRMNFQAAVSLAALSSVTVTGDPGEDIVLVAEHYSGAATNIVVSGRLKGWCYVPTARSPGVVGKLA